MACIASWEVLDLNFEKLILINMPAIEADIRFAMVPASIARTPSLANSPRLFGAKAPIPPICIPMELRLANPHRAKVAIVYERGFNAAFAARHL